MIARIDTIGETTTRPDNTWVDVERFIASHVDRFTRNTGRLTRIARPDGGCSYTSPGSYEVTYTHAALGDYQYTVILLPRDAEPNPEPDGDPCNGGMLLEDPWNPPNGPSY